MQGFTGSPTNSLTDVTYDYTKLFYRNLICHRKIIMHINSSNEITQMAYLDVIRADDNYCMSVTTVCTQMITLP